MIPAGAWEPRRPSGVADNRAVRRELLMPAPAAVIAAGITYPLLIR
jgi:hypothetical protein